MAKVIVTECVEGYYAYHLSPTEKKHQSLCGKLVMETRIPLSSWGSPKPEHFITQSWCSKCYQKAKYLGLLTEKETKP